MQTSACILLPDLRLDDYQVPEAAPGAWLMPSRPKICISTYMRCVISNSGWHVKALLCHNFENHRYPPSSHFATLPLCGLQTRAAWAEDSSVVMHTAVDGAAREVMAAVPPPAPTVILRPVACTPAVAAAPLARLKTPPSPPIPFFGSLISKVWLTLRIHVCIEHSLGVRFELAPNCHVRAQAEMDHVLVSPEVYRNMRAVENYNRLFDPRAKYIKVCCVP